MKKINMKKKHTSQCPTNILTTLMIVMMMHNDHDDDGNYIDSTIRTPATMMMTIKCWWCWKMLSSDRWWIWWFFGTNTWI